MKGKRHVLGKPQGERNGECDVREDILLDTISDRLLGGSLPEEEEYFVRFIVLLEHAIEPKFTCFSLRVM